MKIILDASVLISAFLSTRGGSHAILSKEVDLVTSSKAIGEFYRFVTSNFPDRLAFATRFLDSFPLDIIEPTGIRQFCRDSSDDYLVNLAIETGADFLATLDNDLLVLKRVGRTRIVKPEEITGKG